MANKEIGNWNPMAEAHQNPIFNSYVEGPGSHLSSNQQPFNRSAGGRNRTSTNGNRTADNENKLHITHVPVGMTTEGLKNFFMPFAKPRSVFIPDKKKAGVSTTWAMVEFDTYGDAEAAMRGCNEKPPFNLNIRFSKKPNDDQRHSEQSMSSATPPKLNVQNPFFQEVQPKSDNKRKEALQHIVVKENCLDTDNMSVPILQENDKEGFFLLPSVGEFTGPNAKIMSNEHRLDIEAGGWKMGVNRKYFPPSTPVGNKTRPTFGSNSRSQGTACHAFKAENLENKVSDGQCKVCLKNTSGRCGACRVTYYCSQACATADFRHHMTECYIPVPAVFFSDDEGLGNKTGNPLNPCIGIQNSGNSSLLKKSESPNSNRSLENGNVASPKANEAVASPKTNEGVGGNRDNSHNGFSSFREEDGIQQSKQLRGRQNSFSNESIGNNKASGRKSFGSPGKAYESDKPGLLPSPLLGYGVAEHETNSINIADSDKKSKKKPWVPNEDLEIGVMIQVEVAFRNNFGLYIIKSANKSALENLNEDLKSSWPGFAPFDQNVDTFCVLRYNDAVYRGKVLVNKLGTNPKLRVKHIDYGSISFVASSEVRSLPDNFTEFPAQSIQIRLHEGSPDVYMSYQVGRVLCVKTVEKIDNAAWLVEIDNESNGSGSSTTPVKSALDNSSECVDPFPNTVITPPRAQSCFEDKESSPAVLEPCMDIQSMGMPPLNTFTMVSVTEVKSERIFWGNLSSMQEELTAVESKLNSYLYSKPPTYVPSVNEYVAVLHEECWYRAKVLKLSPVVRLGLIDYGQMIESTVDKISSLPAEIRQIPRQAMKFKIPGLLPLQLRVELKLKVKPVSSAITADGCCVVEIESSSDVSSHEEKQDRNEMPVSSKASSPKPSPASQSARIMTLVQQELPVETYSEVTVTEIAGNTFSVNLAANSTLAVDLFTKLDTYCSQISDSYQPTEGEIVAAKFEDIWYRAKVIAVRPKLRVLYVDYGNESEVTPDQVKMLTKDLTVIPAQAIKIRFSTTTSSKYSELQVDSALSIKPVPGVPKSADGSITVIVEGDVQELAVTPEKSETPEKVPVVTERNVAPFEYVDVPLNEYIEFVITVSEKPVFANLVKEQEQLNDMMLNLNMVLHSGAHSCNLAEGMAVAVSIDDVWHRAEVLTVDPNITVFLLDYGNTCNDITANKIAGLPECYKELPAQAVRIAFIDGTPCKYCIEEETFTAKVVKKLPDGTCVLQPKDETNAISAEEGATLSEELQNSMSQVEKSPQELKNPVQSTSTPTSCSNMASFKNSPSKLPCSEVDILSEEEENEVIVTLNLKNEMWVNLESKAASLIQLMEELEEMKGALQPCTPNINDFVAIYFAPVELWHRGKVLNESSGLYEVLLIDYGCVDNVTTDCLRALPEKFTILPAQGIRIQFTLGSPDKCKKASTDEKIYIKQVTKIEENLSIVSGIDK